MRTVLPSTHLSLTQIPPVLVAPTSQKDPSPPCSPICSLTCEQGRGSQVGLCGAVHGDASQVLHAAPLWGCPTLPCPLGTAFLLVLPLANSTSVTGSPMEPPAPPLSTDAPWQLPVNIHRETQPPWKKLCISILHLPPSLPSQEITANHVSEAGSSPALILTFIQGQGTPLALSLMVTQAQAAKCSSSVCSFPVRAKDSLQFLRDMLPPRCLGKKSGQGRPGCWCQGCMVTARDAGVPSLAVILQSLQHSQGGSGSELAAGCYTGARWWMRLKEFDFQIIHKPG